MCYFIRETFNLLLVGTFCIPSIVPPRTYLARISYFLSPRTFVSYLLPSIHYYWPQDSRLFKIHESYVKKVLISQPILSFIIHVPIFQHPASSGSSDQRPATSDQRTSRTQNQARLEESLVLKLKTLHHTHHASPISIPPIVNNIKSGNNVLLLCQHHEQILP